MVSLSNHERAPFDKLRVIRQAQGEREKQPSIRVS